MHFTYVKVLISKGEVKAFMIYSLFTKKETATCYCKWLFLNFLYTDTI